MRSTGVADHSIMDRVIPEPMSGCWLWGGSLGSWGYGRFKVGGRAIQAHRLVYEIERGPIPEGLVLDHICRNKGCVNPDHLRPVTQRENNLFGDSLTAKFARQTLCKRGHEFDRVYIHAGRAFRLCTQCRKIVDAARRKKGAANG